MVDVGDLGVLAKNGGPRGFHSRRKARVRVRRVVSQRTRFSNFLDFVGLGSRIEGAVCKASNSRVVLIRSLIVV
jgi:hypothetical protein